MCIYIIHIYIYIYICTRSGSVMGLDSVRTPSPRGRIHHDTGDSQGSSTQIREYLSTEYGVRSTGSGFLRKPTGTNCEQKHSFALRTSSTNSHPALDLVLFKLFFPRVLFSRGVVFHRHGYELKDSTTMIPVSVKYTLISNAPVSYVYRPCSPNFKVDELLQHRQFQK